MGAVRYIVVWVLGLLYFVDIPEMLYTGDAEALLVYPFFHANLFHLAVNCLSVWVAFDPRTRPEWWYLPVGYIIAVATYELTPYMMVGFSCVLFAVAGLRTPSFRSPWWKSWNAWAFLGTMGLMFLLPMFAASAHLIAFGMGVAVACIVRFQRKLSHDTRRAKGCK